MARGRILWVDDEIELLKPHILYLQEKEYEVVNVTNGRDAISLVENEEFDLVLLDEMMPGMDGIATLKEIKRKRPPLRVIMITKNEEEWLMDEAISQKIADYLTKPVNPSQIFLACKKILEGDKILDQKTASLYLEDFQEIESRVSSHLEIDDWWNLYVKLVDWQIDLDKRKDLGLGEILDNQIKSANRKFAQFVSDHYLDWIHSSPGDRPTLSTDLLPKLIVPALQAGEKVFLLVVDCFRFDQAMAILPEIRRYFSVEMGFHVSLLPSATPFCRNAIFGARFLREIQDREPEIWQAMVRNEHSMNRFESDMMGKALARAGLTGVSLNYHKVNMAGEGKNFLKHMREYVDSPLIALVVNFVDLLTHNRSRSDVLQEMMPDESGYRSTVKTWFENSWLFEVLKIVSDSSQKVILTTDHGSIRVKKGVQVVADRETSAGVRYKYGKNLNCPDKNALVVKNAGDYLLPEMVTGTNYLIAKEDLYFVYPTEYHRYLKLYRNSFQHGGISMEEMLVPTLILSGKS